MSAKNILQRLLNRLFQKKEAKPHPYDKGPPVDPKAARLREFINRTPALRKYHIMIADQIELDPEQEKRLKAAEAACLAVFEKHAPFTPPDTEVTERDHEVFRDMNEQLKPYFESKPPKE
jgi:hypothetical protein